MRRFLYIMGALALMLVATAVIGLGIFFYTGRSLDAESHAFVDTALPAITTGWSKQQLLDRATPELREKLKPGQLEAFFDDARSRLGALVEYQGATGGSVKSYIIGSGTTVSATYVAKARFQNGTATFRLVLMKRDGRWLIHNFRAEPTLGDGTTK